MTRLAHSVSYAPPTACQWTVNTAGEVVCAVKGKLLTLCAQALANKQRNPGRKGPARLFEQARDEYRAHVCSRAPDMGGGE